MAAVVVDTDVVSFLVKRDTRAEIHSRVQASLRRSVDLLPTVRAFARSSGSTLKFLSKT